MYSFGGFSIQQNRKKRKSDNRLSLSVSKIIAVVLRGLQIFSIHFHATHQTHKNLTKQNRHFPMSISGSCKRPQKQVQTAMCHLDGQDVKSLPLAPSNRDLTCTVKKTCFWGLLKGPKIDIEKCRFSLVELGWLPEGLKNGHSAVKKLPAQHHADNR